jgi:hypothetical protein
VADITYVAISLGSSMSQSFSTRGRALIKRVEHRAIIRGEVVGHAGCLGALIKSNSKAIVGG